METPVTTYLNRSTTAGKTDPDLPNRSFRSRVRSIRWANEPPDLPEPGPFGQRVIHQALPCIPFPEPRVVTRVLQDRASFGLALAGGAQHDHFVILELADRGILLASIGEGHYPRITVAEVTEAVQLGLTLRRGSYRQTIYMETGDAASMSLDLGQGAIFDPVDQIIPNIAYHNPEEGWNHIPPEEELPTSDRKRLIFHFDTSLQVFTVSTSNGELHIGAPFFSTPGIDITAILVRNAMGVFDRYEIYYA